MREIRRKIGHIFLGSLVAAGIFWGKIDAFFLFGISFFLLGFFFIVQKEREKHFFWKEFLDFFERKTNFPGASVVFFFVGCALTAAFFSQKEAAAAILILSFGDSISHLWGRKFGKRTTFLHPEKKIEGTIAGILAGGAAASAIFPIFPAFLAAAIAMILEIPKIKIGKKTIDDNLIVPIVAGFFLHFFSF